MKTILYLLQKEFIQIFRNRTMLPIIFIMPLAQLIILVSAATLEMKRIDLVVTDMDLSPSSRSLVNKFLGSPFFVFAGSTFSPEEAERMLTSDKADMVLQIPAGYEKSLYRKLYLQVEDHSGDIQLRINAINATAAGLINAYSTSIIRSHTLGQIEGISPAAFNSSIKRINIETAFWYNPELNYTTFMLPGVLVILVTVMGMFLAALNLVREKELGTIEQINVTPIRKYQFIAGKLIPFWLIAIFEMYFGLFFGKIVYGVPFEGSYWLLLGFVSVYLLVALGIGLFLSTVSSNQQQVMFVAFFFMLTFVLMSGIFTPVESMPDWARWLNTINPIAYFMRVIRMVMLKGSGFSDIHYEFYALLIFSVFIVSLSVWRYRKIA